jgi:putative flippase GtrA
MNIDLKILVKKFLSFATIGAILTLFTLGTITFCLKFLDTPLQLTYIAVNMVGIMLSFFLNSKYTFKSEITLNNTIRFYAIYLTSMGMGTLLLGLFDSMLSFEKWIYPFMVLPFTLTFNFFMSARFLKPREIAQS